MSGSYDHRLLFLAAVMACGAVLLVGLFVTGGELAPTAGGPVPSQVLQPKSEAAGSPRPTPFAVDTTQTFEEARFKFTLPTGWTVTEVRPDLVTARGQGTSVAVRVGTPDGRIQTCEVPGRAWERCRDVVVTNLGEFAEAVRMAPVLGCTGLCAPSASGPVPTTLGGAEALRVAISGYEYPAHGGEAALYILALHQDRPYFLRFHTSANFAPGSPPGSVWKAIVESFAFVPPVTKEPSSGEGESGEPAAGLQRIPVPAGSLTLDVPDDWRVSEQPRRQRTVISSAEGWVSVEYSDPLGHMAECMGSACQSVEVASFDDLVAVARTDFRQSYGSRPEVEQTPIAVADGVAAWVTLSTGGAEGALTREYVLAYRGGRAVLVKVSMSSPTGLAASFDPGTSDILASIRFLD